MALSGHARARWREVVGGSLSQLLQGQSAHETLRAVTTQQGVADPRVAAQASKSHSPPTCRLRRLLKALARQIRSPRAMPPKPSRIKVTPPPASWVAGMAMTANGPRPSPDQQDAISTPLAAVTALRIAAVINPPSPTRHQGPARVRPYPARRLENPLPLRRRDCRRRVRGQPGGSGTQPCINRPL